MEFSKLKTIWRCVKCFYDFRDVWSSYIIYYPFEYVEIDARLEQLLYNMLLSLF